MRLMSIFAMSIFWVATGFAQINESSSLPEIEFSQLSQRDPNPLGEKALAIHPEQWKHAETEHFIYHFVHSYVATPVSVEAEFHYRVIAKELEREQPAGDIKSHIYIFERPEEWHRPDQDRAETPPGEIYPQFRTSPLPRLSAEIADDVVAVLVLKHRTK